MNAAPLSNEATQYIDAAKHAGRYYEYQVKAIYPDYGEVGSNVVRIMATGIDAVTTDGTGAAAPAYNLKGVRAGKSEHGPVIVGGVKRMQ